MAEKKEYIKRILIIFALALFLIFISRFQDVRKAQLTTQKGSYYETAKVLQVIRDNKNQDGSRTGYQTVKVKITSGQYKGRSINATSSAGYLSGAVCRKGMSVTVNLSVSGKKAVCTVFNYNREPQIFMFAGLFLLIICLIGGKQGIRSAAALVFTFLCILYLYIPMLYKGYSPFLAAVIVCALTTIVTMYLIGGFSKKTFCSIMGTIFGVICAGAIASLFGAVSHINGMNVSDIEELVYIAAHSKLNVSGMLFSGILISALGAVMDVSMSVSSTISEIHSKKPELTARELFASGIHVGRDMMGTMSNTLILAYTGGSLSTMIWIYAYNLQYHQVMNMYSIGIEIMQGIAGSMGVVLTVPLVSALCAWSYTRKRKHPVQV